jgi:hypothetical protein
LQRKSIIPKVEIVDRLKRKFIRYGTNSYVNEGSFKVTNDFGIIPSSTTISKEEKKYSCWSFLSVDEGVKIEAKIVHKRRDKFKILEDKYRGKHINKIVDESDVIRCTEIS